MNEYADLYRQLRNDLADARSRRIDIQDELWDVDIEIEELEDELSALASQQEVAEVLKEDDEAERMARLQRKLLEKRYGTPTPPSIRDYWMVQP